MFDQIEKTLPPFGTINRRRFARYYLAPSTLLILGLSSALLLASGKPLSDTAIIAVIFVLVFHALGGLLSALVMALLIFQSLSIGSPEGIGAADILAGIPALFAFFYVIGMHGRLAVTYREEGRSGGLVNLPLTSLWCYAEVIGSLWRDRV